MTLADELKASVRTYKRDTENAERDWSNRTRVGNSQDSSQVPLPPEVLLGKDVHTIRTREGFPLGKVRAVYQGCRQGCWNRTGPGFLPVPASLVAEMGCN